MSECTCARLSVGDGCRNWNPDCPQHGVRTEWWQSSEQTEKRQKQNKRLRELQRLARLAKTDHPAALRGLAKLDREEQ